MELDCAPGGIRPGDLIGRVIDGARLKKREHVSYLFSNWTWGYSEVPDEDLFLIQQILKGTLQFCRVKFVRYEYW